ncbi:uncharacterized protein EV154DRAFT_482268 [Mucor mucedo]|uniref:uncharacterized protein n=1 Tax=Mucor mucedo TaxID=29922 RepID=UPI002220E8D6|nr:uncharacterized protein EV154DRAFT_482268 [Mucor mucedo]KAI7890427.1 hypothetical protein EV154DRAFT_482268 [Mucor mucedo]
MTLAMSNSAFFFSCAFCFFWGAITVFVKENVFSFFLSQLPFPSAKSELIEGSNNNDEYSDDNIINYLIMRREKNKENQDNNNDNIKANPTPVNEKAVFCAGVSPSLPPQSRSVAPSPAVANFVGLSLSCASSARAPCSLRGSSAKPRLATSSGVASSCGLSRPSSLCSGTLRDLSLPSSVPSWAIGCELITNALLANDALVRAPSFVAETQLPKQMWTSTAASFENVEGLDDFASSLAGCVGNEHLTTGVASPPATACTGVSSFVVGGDMSVESLPLVSPVLSSSSDPGINPVDVLQDNPDVAAVDLGLGGAVVPFVAGGTSDSSFYSCSVARSPLFEVSSVTPALAPNTVSLGSSSPWCFPASVDVNPAKPFTFDNEMDCDFAVFGSWVSVGSSWSSSSSFVDEHTSLKRKLSCASFRPSDVEPEAKCQRSFRVSGWSVAAKKKSKPVPPSPESVPVTKGFSGVSHKTLVSHTGLPRQNNVEHRNRVRVKREFMGSLETIHEEEEETP